MTRSDKHKRSKKNTLRNVLAGLLLLIGVVLIFSDTIRNMILEHQVNSQSSIIQTISAEELAQNNNTEATFNFDDINAISIENVLSNSLDRSKVPSIGAIAIPSIEVNLTIAKGVTDINMLVGAGTLRADQQMGQGNYPLASHYTTAGDGKLLFTPLLKIENGAKIYLTDLVNVYTYTTYWAEYVEPTRVDLVYEDTETPIVTLITCYDISGQGRWAVRGKLESVTPLSEASEEAIKAFKLENRTF